MRASLKQGRIHGNPVAKGWAGALKIEIKNVKNERTYWRTDGHSNNLRSFRKSATTKNVNVSPILKRLLM